MPLAELQAILSGERTGVFASLLRGVLLGLSLIYGLAMRLRNALYDRGLKRVKRLDCTVISVGNLTVGGTGKTPLVEYLVRHLLAQTPRVAIVSRGYGARHAEANDEKRMLARNLPEVPHVAAADRHAAGLKAMREHDARVIVLDDGFQHRRLARDLDVVTVDATNPFGHGYLLPRGLLREPASALRRADVVVITRTGIAEAHKVDGLEARIRAIAPDALVCRASEEVTALETLQGEKLAPDALDGKHVAAFCGVGNPRAFRATIESLGADVERFLVFDDHHVYTDVDLRAIDAAAPGASLRVTTHKDRVKLPDGFHWSRPVIFVRISIRITQGEEELQSRLDAVLRD